MERKTNLRTITAKLDGKLKTCVLKQDRSEMKIIKGSRELRSIIKNFKSGSHLQNINNNSFPASGTVMDSFGIKFISHQAKLLESGEIVTYMGKLCTKSPNMLSVFHDACLMAHSGDPVLLNGETGSGKELFAQAIHFNSRTVCHTTSLSGQFLPINCAAIPSELMEAELFGYSRGAFTGAYEQRKGAFHSAHEGTLFLDEIGELNLYLQPKLLRVLDSGEIKKIGESKVTIINARVIAATNKNLLNEVMKGHFRSDLFHRLSCLNLTVPPLRERKEDIPILVDEIISELNGGAEYEISANAIEKLLKYDFPGNVRELKNCIKRAMFKSQRKVIQKSDIEFQTYIKPSELDMCLNLSENKVNFYSNAEEIIEKLFNQKKNISRSLKKLGIPRSTFYKNYYPLIKQAK